MSSQFFLLNKHHKFLSQKNHYEKLLKFVMKRENEKNSNKNQLNI